MISCAGHTVEDNLKDLLQLLRKDSSVNKFRIHCPDFVLTAVRTRLSKEQL